MRGKPVPGRLVWSGLLAALVALALCGEARRAPPRAPVSETPPPALVPVVAVPDSPLQGSAVIVVVGPDTGAVAARDPVVAVEGSMAGQPLRFEADAAGRFRALGAVPLDARRRLLVPLSLVRRSGDTLYQPVRLPVRERPVEISRIRLAQEFVTPPESLRFQIEEERRILRQALARTARTPRLWAAEFAQPLRGRVTGAFGVRREINRTVRSVHLGVDLAAPPGTPVVAANRGVVALAGQFYFQGNAVYLDHGGGLVTAYLHLSDVLVAPGDTVGAGQPIGRVGATGRVTGPHLHWSAYFGRILFDPLSLLAPEIGALGAGP